MTGLTDVAEPPAPPGHDDAPAEDDDSGYVPTAWEFLGDPPKIEEVQDKLLGLPPYFGEIRPERYVEFVQPLPQDKNIALQKGEKNYVRAWTLYFTVAGRIAMVNDAAWAHGWRVDFEPEPNVPDGNPAGYVQYDPPDVENGRIVYREYMSIYDESDRLLGRKPGTAWVPSAGGAQAVGSNRFEKVETSTRGRSIAAWGIGILPGSGVASLDEMRDAAGLGQVERENRPARRARREAPKREDVEATLRETLVEYQQLSGLEVEEVDEKVTSYVRASFAKEVVRSEGGPFDLSSLKDGELGLLLNQMKRGVEKYRAQDPNNI